MNVLTLKNVLLLTTAVLLIESISGESGYLMANDVAHSSGDNSAQDPFTSIINIAPVIDEDCSFGVSWVDYDKDSYSDLFVTRWWPSEARLNALYHNNGDGTFSIVPDAAPSKEGNALGATWGDFDNDGDEDLFTARFEPRPTGTNNRLYRNDGKGVFTSITDGSVVTDTVFSVHTMFGDFDNDGDLDLFAGFHHPRLQGEGLYYRNDAGNFMHVPIGEIGMAAGDFGAMMAADVDNDGDLDFVHARNMLTSLFYTNDGDGTFTAIANAISTDTTRTYCWGDYDNDGDFDLCGINNMNDGPIVYQNDGAGNFRRLPLGLGDAGMSGDPKPYWADYDNDGDLDLLIVNQGDMYSRVHNALYVNLGDGIFKRVHNSVVVTDSGASSGAAWADYDRDGDLDLFVARTNFGRNALYLNEIGNINNWICIKCIGSSSNRSGIGARIFIKARINDKDVRQLRQITGQSGFFGQDEMRAYFGLGKAVVIDTLRVEWPSGVVDISTGVSVNQFLTITESARNEP